jgi:hypothetical protein
MHYQYILTDIKPILNKEFIFNFLKNINKSNRCRVHPNLKGLAEWFSSKFTLYRQSFDYSTP